MLTDTELNELIVKTGRSATARSAISDARPIVGWLRDLHGALKAQFLFKYTLRPEQL